MLSSFITRLRSIYPISKGLEEELRGMEIIDVPKGTLLLREGEREDYCWIVLQGLTRTYYLKDGEEISSRFNSEDQIVVSIGAFYSRTPSHEFVETLEDCVLAQIHYDRLQKIYHEHIEFNFHARVLTQGYLALSEQRLYLLRKQSAEERYRYFMEHYPEWLLRVPLKHCATFMGMNIETLSRVRKKVSEGGL